MQRRFGWEYNGMRLHELYFENLQKENAAEPTGLLKEKMEKIYGSVEKWQEGFKNIGSIRGIGWGVLCWDENQDKLFNIWVNEHDMGLLAGTKILLVMDVFEHAFMLDYGLKRADYIETFFSHIDWSVVAKRFAA
jgi:Fe-Mn family superoxide dismutase